MDATRNRDGTGAIAALAALCAFAVAAFAPQVLNDGDTFLHVAAGQRMLADHAILFRDPFSYTFAGARWDAHEWLGEILMALAYRLGGWSGLLVLFGAAAALAAYVLSRTLGRWLGPKGQALATVLALACMTASLLARPHLLALPLLAIWTAGLVQARSERRAPSPWLLPVMTLWINIHGSFLLGLALAAALAVEAVAQDAAAWRGWALFGAGALGAALVNPHVAAGVVFPLTLMATPALAHVGEWQATPFSPFEPIVPASLATLYIIVTRRVRVPWIRAGVLLVLLAMAFLHQRHQIVAATIAPLLLAEPLSRAAGRRDDAARVPMPVAAGALLCLLAALRLALPLSRGDAPIAPVAALAHVPAGLRAMPVLNDYSFGGYLIFAGVRPFIDSRAELYGEAALERYAALIRPDRAALDTALARYRVQWSILPPASPIVAELDATPGWRRLYADRYAVVQIRDGARR